MNLHSIETIISGGNLPETDPGQIAPDYGEEDVASQQCEPSLGKANATAPRLLLFASDCHSDSEVALQQFAALLGIEAHFVGLDDIAGYQAQIVEDGPLSAAACSLTTLVELHRLPRFGEFLEQCRHFLVFGSEAGLAEAGALAWYTDGALVRVEPPKAGRCLLEVERATPLAVLPVAGLSCEDVFGHGGTFGTGASASVNDGYVTIDGRPYLAGYQSKRNLRFALCQSALVSIQQELPVRSTALRTWYPELISLSIFFRVAFGPWCWSAPGTPASFIVDDPTLTPRYGYLEFKKLLREVALRGTALTLGFIPFNYRRSHRETTAALRQEADRVSICVHGCDHTTAEYAETDEVWLESATACAVKRMDLHRESTGVDYDRVFIFPQGFFTIESVSVLARFGFSAIVNSIVWPINGARNPLTIRDLLEVAATRYVGLSIFSRRYTRELFDLAFDALFQKPILAAEYHDFFRDGFAAFDKFVSQVDALRTPVRWQTLGEALAASCILRQIGPDRFSLRHWADDLEWTNQSGRDARLKVEKPQSAGKILEVRRGAQSIPFTQAEGMLRYELEVRAGDTLRVSIRREVAAGKLRDFSLSHQVACILRRFLSEVRDNYLSRSRLLLRLIRSLTPSAWRVRWE